MLEKLKSGFFRFKFQILALLVVSSLFVGFKSPSIIEEDSIEAHEATPIKYHESNLIWRKTPNGTIEIDINKSISVNAILAEAGLKSFESLYNAVRKSVGTIIKPDTRLQIEYKKLNDDEVIPYKLTILSNTHKIQLTHNPQSNTYEVKKRPLPLEWQVKVVSGTINGSLYQAIKKSGADPQIVQQLVGLFSHEVDFQRDIKLGDQFKILYEYETNFRGNIVKNPKILYATLNLSGSSKEIFRYSISGKSIDYFNRKGVSIKKSLLRTPISGARITSTFGYRIHPVLGYSRMHQGLDYGAPRGTPIFAAGDGIIDFVKDQRRGYGKHIQIRHANSYSTLYAHLARFAKGIKPGRRVRQGELIGYLGDTGLATGPHLHFEVAFKGKKVNPAKVNAPMIAPLKGAALNKFKDNVAKLEQMVVELDDKKVFASNTY